MGRCFRLRRRSVLRLIHELLVTFFEAVEPFGEFEKPLTELAQSDIVLIGSTVGKELGFLDSARLIFVHGLPGSLTCDRVRTMAYRVLPAIVLGLVTPGATLAEPGRLPSLFHPTSIDSPLPQPEPGDTPSDTQYRAFGARDTDHFTLGTLLAPDFEGNVDVNLHLQYTYFLIDDFEVGAEGAFWGFFQSDDAYGFSMSLVMRYHFYKAERWTAFADVGMGLLQSSDDVPDTGTDFNLMPRLGAGVTWQIFDDSPVRAITGLRWHHISNARIKGEEDNPARDAIGLYMGLMYEF